MADSGLRPRSADAEPDVAYATCAAQPGSSSGAERVPEPSWPGTAMSPSPRECTGQWLRALPITVCLVCLISGVSSPAEGSRASAANSPQRPPLRGAVPTDLGRCSRQPEGEWSLISQDGAPSTPGLVTQAIGVWTGRELIVWGKNLSYGARYDPATDHWTPISSEGAPSPRENSVTVWTGREMIIWGGEARPGERLNDGARYNPSTDIWTPLPAEGAPSPRVGAAAVWTGSEMAVAGGDGVSTSSLLPFPDDGSRYNLPLASDGARYNPATDTWAPLPSTPFYQSYEGGSTYPVIGGQKQPMVWTGEELLLWAGQWAGGGPSDRFPGAGARWNPTMDSWTSLSRVDAPSARGAAATAWTGRRLLIWGGTPGLGWGLSTGASYDPATDTWHPLSADGAPSSRWTPFAVWTGRELIVWGGGTATGERRPVALDDGAAYDPATDTWRTLPPAPILGRRWGVAVWTGEEMLVWGSPEANLPPFHEPGHAPAGPQPLQPDGARYLPPCGREVGSVKHPPGAGS
jgi:N-acetylneuraminic acid mutarotase